MRAVTEENQILVTGASGEIGRATSLVLAQSGFSIVAHYHDGRPAVDELIEEVRSLGGRARALQFDVSDRAGCKSTIERDIGVHGAYYGVVASAGITRDNAFPAMSGDEWDSVLHTNLDSFYNVLQPIIMPMIRLHRGGRIVTVSSISGIIGNRGQTNYSASKAGLIGATKALAVELGKRKITVNCVAPGVIETDMVDGVVHDEVKKMIPLGRFGRVEEVAATIAFLMSDSAAYITRQVISVNGGMY
jgi:3-oxoacyl-[acyl-carrier protein] reductase